MCVRRWAFPIHGLQLLKTLGDVQGLSCDSSFLHREAKQGDGNSCLTIGTVKARRTLDPLSGEVEGKEKEKKKDTTRSSF